MNKKVFGVPFYGILIIGVIGYYFWEQEQKKKAAAAAPKK